MENDKKSNGIGICGMLTIVFITLRLCGVIDWAWAWVLAPMWIGYGLCLLVWFIIVLIVKRRY